MTTSTSVQRSITTTDTRIGPPDAVRTDRSISAAWQRVTGAPISVAVLEWPPNLFALTDVVLHRSEAYRFALSREASRPVRPTDWSAAVVAAGVEWSAVVGGDDRIPERARAERQGTDDPHLLGGGTRRSGVRGFRTPRNLPCRRLRRCSMGGSNLGFLSRRRAFAQLSPRSATLPGGPPLPTRSRP